MSQQNVKLALLRPGLIAVLAISLIMGFGGPQQALADPVSPLSVTSRPAPAR